MLFSTVLLCSSFSILSALAAPIPMRRHLARAPSGGWPQSNEANGGNFGVTGGFNQRFLKTIEGQPTLVGNYPKGSYAGSKATKENQSPPGIAGFIFSASGGPDVDIESAKEVKLTYQVKFPADFEWALGGKMPGLYGGNNAQTAGQCSGGRHSDECWSARLMWRDNGKGELYAYLPTANQKLPICKGKCDVKYGASIGTGKWTYAPGQWTTITERVKLNDVEKMNGEIEILINGQSQVKVDGLQLRGDSNGRIRGIMMHTFFGGSSSPNFQSPKNQEAYFRDFALEVTEKLNGKAE
ncbi:hypothetical protein D9615_003453 [Tricholomella constricta]|uniref:Polysaccharide lyase 14 domain-containing protein n=1 Tax=Tricholomella constricta TaxID=117010 RepID=A0A8H5HIZ2_9AGAR|nr:hypothetical protein D9615_003453 [Tricholomella constricta]